MVTSMSARAYLLETFEISSARILEDPNFFLAQLMFDNGADSFEIARGLKVHESDVVRWLTALRNRRRRLARENKLTK